MTPRTCLIGVVGALLALALAAGQCPAPAALAQGPTPTPDDGRCRTCHEPLYYLHDTGSWTCLCEAAGPACADCHGGQPAATGADEAHAGMRANPLQDDAAACQSCHPDTYNDRVAVFVARAGIARSNEPGQTYPTPDAGQGQDPTRSAAYRLPEQLHDPVRVALLVVTGAALLVSLYFGVCCYRHDHRRPSAP
jgi:hypothetical protein